jgi:hypothetical protein
MDAASEMEAQAERDRDAHLAHADGVESGEVG